MWSKGSRLSVAWRSADYFRDILTSFRAAFPRHGDATFDSQSRAWSVPAWRRPALERWLWETFEPAAICWEDVPSSSSFPGSRGRTPSPPATPLAAAYATLHLTPSAPAELVQAAQRILLKQHHPDRGGSHERAVAINAAIAIIRDAQCARSGESHS